MNQPKRIQFIRFVYWLGALADAASTLAMLLPGTMLSFPPVDLSAATRSAFAAGAALMLGWTCLLLWASAEPVARRGILLITMVPVIPGIAVSMFYGYRHGCMPLATTLPMWFGQAVIFLLMGIAYRVARSEATETTDRSST